MEFRGVTIVGIICATVVIVTLIVSITWYNFRLADIGYSSTSTYYYGRK